MSVPNRISSIRPSSVGTAPGSGQSPALVARINEKRAELENLKQLKELSGNLADQMQALEDRLSTLSDGTEAVAAVLSNWQNVLRAINMASTKVAQTAPRTAQSEAAKPEETPLPQTLVRIPAEQNPQQP